ncbi:MAG: hypothetical protein LBN33_04395 [Desulfovibrio sp.]|jgi:uncharacterized protein YfaS (alpha-2-macroglobulin family)|nr:hypothetical protein [Desulfovibrio sp.]
MDEAGKDKGAQNATSSAPEGKPAAIAGGEPADSPAAPRLLNTGFATTGSGQGVFLLRFSAPMPGADERDASGPVILPPERLPVEFSPPVPGEGTWMSPTELRFISYDRLARATTYNLKARAGVKGQGAAPFEGTASFTPYPFLWNDAGQTRYYKDGTVQLKLHFSDRVDAAKFRAAFAVRSKEGTKTGPLLPFEVKTEQGRENAANELEVLVKPERLGQLELSLPAGFAGEDGPQGFESANTRLIETTSLLQIQTVRSRHTDSPPWDRYIEVKTTNSADMDTVRQYMEITPATEVRIEATSSGFNISGDFINKPRLTLTFKKGMPGLLGHLTEDFTSTVIFKDFSPRLAIDTRGSVLSPLRSLLVPVSSLNVERVQATLWQLPESNIPLMSMGFFNSYRKELSHKFAVRGGAVNGARNRVVESAIDLAPMAGKTKGVFLLSVSNDSDSQNVGAGESGEDDSDEYYEDEGLERLVVISDIGIAARLLPDGITVWTNSIAAAEAVKDARVRLFTANNILLAEGLTDKDGLWHYSRKEPWKEGLERPALVLVSTDEKNTRAPSDMAYLKFESALNRDSSFDIYGKPYLRQGYEAFCFTPRGIFRPGETVDFKIITRDAQMRPPASFPVAWKVESSTGRTVGQGTAQLSAEGAAAFSLSLAPTSPTGRYSMRVSIPGQKAIGGCVFSVEEFAPPRIEVKLEAEQQVLVGDAEASVNIDAGYLFGAPVAEGEWGLEVKALPYHFQPGDWRAYTFPAGDAPGNDSSFSSTGNLDAEGRGRIAYTPSGLDKSNSALVSFTVRVQEDGGRWVARAVSVPWFRSSVLLGYEKTEAVPQAGAPYSLRVAAVTPEGRAASLNKVKVFAERRQDYYVRSDRGYAQSVRFVQVAEQEVAVSEGVGLFSFTPPQRGVYRIRFEDKEQGARAEAALDVWSGVAGSGDGGSPLVDRVMLSWDKERYRAGETAKLSVRAPFTGKLLLTLESDREISRRVLSMDKAEMSLEVPVSRDMAPNAYCSAWLIRPVRPNEVWGAHRAFGLIPLNVDMAQARLSVDLEAPEEITPKGELPVSITLKDAAGKAAPGEVALALVDEGLLSLTAFETPDPFGFFTFKRALGSSAFDLYDNLMPLSARKALALSPGGDGADLLSPLTRKLEFLSIFLGVLKTDENGRASALLKLPEYSGKARLMAVAVNASAVGNAAREVRVARAVTVEATVPRMVAPGDVFTAPVFVFASDPAPRKVLVSLVTEGPLSLAGAKQYSLSLDAKNPKASLLLPLKAEAGSGMGVLRILTSIEGGPPDTASGMSAERAADLARREAPFEQRLEVPVRPPFPRVTRTGSGMIRSDAVGNIDVGGGFFKDTQKVSLAFAGTPGISLMQALDYLDSYPYGCLEQTVSGAWPYLAVPAMLKSLDPAKAQDTEFRQGLDYAVRRILSMQRLDGGFNMWPGRGEQSAYAWGSVYAAHFLSEAKSSGLVPDDALNAVLVWMRSRLADPLPVDLWALRDALSAKAYICYVLALNKDVPLGWMQFIKDQKDFLSPSARIFLAGAQALGTGKTAALKELDRASAHWPYGPGWSYESPARNEALRLLMWANADPFAPESVALAAKVMETGRKNQWQNTQENGMAVLGLGRYTEKTATSGKFYEAILTAQSKDGPIEIRTFQDGENPVFSRKDLCPAGAEDPLPLAVNVFGEAPVYYSWQSSGVPTSPPDPAFKGLIAARRWLLENGETVDFMDYGPGGEIKNAKREVRVPHGSKVTVLLYLKAAAPFNSLALTDIAPGGFELENPGLIPGEGGEPPVMPKDPKTGLALKAPELFGQPLSLNSYEQTRVEMRDDRLLLFVNAVPGRPAFFTYSLRAVHKGEFMLPPLAAEAMYDPAISAVGVPGRVKVE